MSETSANSERPPRRRAPVPHLATVMQTRRISEGVVRLTLQSSAPLTEMALIFTDHYIKLLFPPLDAPWSWNDTNLNPATVREVYPRTQWPVMRTYTLRSWDTDANTVDVDVVVHANSDRQGVGGPWAATVQPGERIAFAGPGGAWRPEPRYRRFVLVGDEAAAPAIFAAIEALPTGSSADVFLEEEDAFHQLEVPIAHSGAHVTVHRVERNGAVHGVELARTVVESALAEEEDISWFVHGVAEMVRELRRHLFVDNHLDRADVSISGYWRLGMVEDEWQASKKEFNAALAAEEEAAHAARRE